jgi:hypothetical protein
MVHQNVVGIVDSDLDTKIARYYKTLIHAHWPSNPKYKSNPA